MSGALVGIGVVMNSSWTARGDDVHPDQHPTSGLTRGDSGLTLLEVAVGMAISAVLMAIFTTGVVGMYRVVNHTEAASNAKTQINLLMLRLDKEIRYAEGISQDRRVAGAWYVEYRVRNMETRSIDCVGLRLLAAPGRLERRAWAPGVSPGGARWLPLAVGVGPSAALAHGESPLKRLDAHENSDFQRLRLRIETIPQGDGSAPTKQTDISFTALNTSPITSSDTVCSEGGPT